MFGRRKRAASNPPFNVNGSTADPSATTAAAQAFLAKSKSNANLSAAAAATALRSRPTTPTNVADVQTKRTRRRSNSTSSRTSSAAGSVPGRPNSSQLERRLSSGSMSERTFRDPSPGRGTARPSAQDAPPVPTIPQNLIEQGSPGAVRRSASVQPPMRISSPPLNKANGRGSSLQPTMRTQPTRRSGPRVASMAGLDELTDTDPTDRRGSVNFSLPTSLRRRSASTSQWMLTPNQSSSQNVASANKDEVVYDPNTRTMRTRADMLFYERGFRDVAEKPVRRKRSMRSGQGSHLAEGSTGGRVKGKAVDRASANIQERQSQEPDRGLLNEPASRIQRVASPRNSVRGSSASDNESDASEKPRKYNGRAGTQLAERPSIVKEEREQEEEGDSLKVLGRQAAMRSLEGGNRGISPTPLPRTPSGRAQHFDGDIGSSRDQSQPSTEVGSGAVSGAQKPLPPLDTGMETAAVADVAKAPVDRGSSLSPSRPSRARFLAAPDTTSHFSRRHEPPSRSISPRKSALKQTPSPRGPSPMGENPAGWTMGHGSGELSDSSTNPSEDRVLPRKKSVRVSFDDGSNVVLRDEPEPVEARRVWSGGYVRSGKAGSPAYEAGPDEIMGPRPVLPSFGSVRKKDHREAEDRPLVKPSDVQVVSPATSPVREYPVGQSVDHGVGAVLSRELASRNVANISRSREPLPPRVTSVEGSGYVSDSDYSVEEEGEGQAPDALWKPKFAEDLDTIPETDASIDESTPEHRALSSPPDDDDVIALTSKANGNGHAAPTFTVTHATPVLEQDAWQPTMQGGLAEKSREAEDNEGDKEISVKEYAAENNKNSNETPASLGIAEPDPEPHALSSPVVEGIAAENMYEARPGTADTARTVDTVDTSDGSSVYSDAAEDLEAEGEMFLSLDAIAAAPNGSTEPATANEPATSEEWDKTQRYWSGLPADMRRQMELEALQEGEASGSEAMSQTQKAVAAPATIPQTSVRTERQRARQALEGTLTRTYQIAPGAAAGPNGAPATARTSSVRAAKPAGQGEPQMRRSMHDSGAGSLRKRGSTRRAAPNTSAPAAKGLPPATATAARPRPPPLRRAGSADSASSFCRDRPAKDGYHMKRSMRGTSMREPAVSGGGSAAHRHSMRAVSPGPTLRGGRPASPKSPPRRLFGLGKSSSVGASAAPPRLFRGSRFADSSDEEDEAALDARTRTRFRSRFADSSDEEEEAPAPRPARGGGGLFHARAQQGQGAQLLRPIPMREGGESSDLPDSDDEVLGGVHEAAVRMARENFLAGGAAGVQPPQLLLQMPQEQPHVRKESTGFLGRLRRKRAEPGVANGGPAMTTQQQQQQQQQQPKLQKKLARGSWMGGPPAPPVVGAGEGRPATSEGVVLGTPPPSSAGRGVLRRNRTGEVEPADEGGKKKKFGLLRRFFEF